MLYLLGLGDTVSAWAPMRKQSLRLIFHEGGLLENLISGSHE